MTKDISAERTNIVTAAVATEYDAASLSAIIAAAAPAAYPSVRAADLLIPDLIRPGERKTAVTPVKCRQPETTGLLILIQRSDSGTADKSAAVNRTPVNPVTRIPALIHNNCNFPVRIAAIDENAARKISNPLKR